MPLNIGGPHTALSFIVKMQQQIKSLTCNLENGREKSPHPAAEAIWSLVANPRPAELSEALD